MKRQTLIEMLEKGPESKIGITPYNPGPPEYKEVLLKLKKTKTKRKYLENA